MPNFASGISQPSRRTTRRPALVGVGLLIVGSMALFVPGSSAGGTCFGRAPTIEGNSSDNTLVGTPGRDVIMGRGGADTVRGRGGKDFICGNNGEDVLNGGSGADKMKGARGIDYLAGNKGDDKMIGGAQDDEVHAEIGRPSDVDIAIGAKGSDFLDTQDGVDNDTARGGGGADTCNTDGGDAIAGC